MSPEDHYNVSREHGGFDGWAWSKEHAEGEGNSPQFGIIEADRMIIREHLLETVIHIESDQLRRLLADCLKFMAETDAAVWLPQAVAQATLRKYLTLGAASVPQMCAALDAIHKIEGGLPQDQIPALINELFIPMMTIGKAAIDGPVASPSGALVLKMICKILYHANPTSLWDGDAGSNQPSILDNQSDVVTGSAESACVDFLATVVQRELPATGEDDFLVQFWLPKKWASFNGIFIPKKVLPFWWENLKFIKAAIRFIRTALDFWGNVRKYEDVGMYSNPT
eukprot:471400-Hanusia_phi.AAC.6